MSPERAWIIEIHWVDLSLREDDPRGIHSKRMVSAPRIDDEGVDLILAHEFQTAIRSMRAFDRKMTVGEE